MAITNGDKDKAATLFHEITILFENLRKEVGDEDAYPIIGAVIASLARAVIQATDTERSFIKLLVRAIYEGMSKREEDDS